MRSALFRLFCATAASLLGGSALAIANSTDLKENYQSIIERNPFGLKDPPVAKPPTNAPAQVQPKQKIFLTGITSVGYPRIPKYAYLKTEEEGKKEPNFYTLQEDQSKDGITVLQIDDRNKKVKIRTNDGEKLLSFSTDGIAPPVAPAQLPGPGGQPGVNPIPIPGQPGNMPHPVNTAAAPQPINQGYNPPANQAQPNYAANAGTRIPARNVRIRAGGDTGYGAPGAAVPNPQGQQQQQAVDPAVQYLMMKAQEQQHISQGLPPVPPVPPAD